jgi:broad specificity phosphatase PhoE
MQKHVYLVRHGETDSNADGIMRGEKAMLSEKGKKEAMLVAERINRIGVKALISSPFPRTMETAKAIATRTSLSIEENKLFIEWKRPSQMIGKSWKSPETSKFDRELFAAYAKNHHHRHSDEENFAEFKARAHSALDFLATHSATKICVVTHGIFLRALFGAAVFGEAYNGRDFERIVFHITTTNTGVTLLELDDQGWHLKTWNDSAHLG